MRDGPIKCLVRSIEADFAWLMRVSTGLRGGKGSVTVGSTCAFACGLVGVAAWRCMLQPRNPRVKAYFETLDLAVHEGAAFAWQGMSVTGFRVKQGEINRNNHHLNNLNALLVFEERHIVRHNNVNTSSGRQNGM